MTEPLHRETLPVGVAGSSAQATGAPTHIETVQSSLAAILDTLMAAHHQLDIIFGIDDAPETTAPAVAGVAELTALIVGRVSDLHMRVSTLRDQLGQI